MTKKEKYLVALDVGSTKTCAIISELTETGVKFLAMGAAESKGLRKGLIANISAAAASVRRAIEEAENVAGVPVERVIAGVAGGHVRGVNSRGGITLGHRPRDINRDDVHHAVDAARNIRCQRIAWCCTSCRRNFCSTSHDNIRDPLGMIGARLEVNVHLVTSSASAMQNLVIAINQAGVEVADTVLEPRLPRNPASRRMSANWAAACSILAAARRSWWSSATACCATRPPFPWAAIILRTTWRSGFAHADSGGGEHQARARMRVQGFRSVEDHAIEIASVGDRPPRTVFTRMLNEIVEPRAQELLSLVRDELQRSGFASLIPAGLVLAGGGAHLKGLVELSESMFHLPARVAVPRTFEGMPEQLSRPEYATVVGLLRTAREPGARRRRSR